MKIAMIGHKRIPSREGGVEIAVEALAVRMAACGHNVTVYNRGGSPHSDRETYRGVHIRRVPVIEKRGLSAVTGSFFASVRALFGRYDCIHFHAEGPAFMTFLPRLFGIRTIVTVHGLDWKRNKWGRFASLYIRQGEKIAAACADEIIVLSRAVQQYFRDTYHRETIYIPNGVERPEKLPASPLLDKWDVRSGEYILFLGRIVPEKGVHYLIEAFRQIRTDKKLVIAGGPSDTETYYEELCKSAEGDDRIKFIGFVQGQELNALYSNCYLYCLPSELEGMPISLLEAMSYGNCCLTSDIPECTEIMGPYGYTFRCGSSEDLQAKLQMLCDHPEMAKTCRIQTAEFVLSRHSWEAVTEQTLALYAGRS